jgi:alginate O-acetyltransferase complex protein AlgI
MCIFRSAVTGTALVVERRCGWAVAAAGSKRRALIVVLGWVLFRSPDLSTALVFLLPAQPITESVRSSRPATALRVGVRTADLLYAALLVTTGTFSPFRYYRF